jgi:transposase
VAAERKAWREQLHKLDPAKLVFVDETGAATNMARRYGRCKIGKRLLCKVPNGHWKTITFVAGLRHDKLTAPMVLDGPMTGDAFLLWVRQFLVPTLSPGDTVIIDNLSSHKVAGVREAIEAAGAILLYLPPYSPDFNPIEQVFAKLKTLLRKAAARTLEALENAIAVALNAFSPQECTNYITAAGYVLHLREVL